MFSKLFIRRCLLIMPCNNCRRIFSNKIFGKRVIRQYATNNSTESSEQERTKKFFQPEVQDLLKKLTRMDLDKVYRPRKIGKPLYPPLYKFLTTEELNKLKSEAEKKVWKKLQMPPVLPPREEIEEILSEDPEIIGYLESKFVFTDISFDKNDRNRMIVVREPNGILRKARWSERDRMNQVYFPQSCRQLKPPQMFQEEYLKGLWERGEYEFVLDRACCQYEPDDPEYIRVTSITYDAVDEAQTYESLRSTRHYGPLVFHLASKTNIDNLLLENLRTDSLEDAVWAISLYDMLHSTITSTTAATFDPDMELNMIKSFIDSHAIKKSLLDLALQSYKELQKLPLEKTRVAAN